MRYETAVPIGSGGMGEVYKAFDPVLKRWVALKYPRWDRPGVAERFLREARLQARVDHEGVCRVYEIGDDEGRSYIAMQYIEGRTLDVAAAEMSQREKVEVLRLAAEAVHAAHQTGLVHRDLKPHNIMVEREGASWRPYVMDFGLAREHAAEGLTRTGMVLGTPAYMAPEQALGQAAVDRRADVYSLGAVLYHLLAGHPPFEGAEIDVILKVAHADARSLRGADPAVPADLDTIVMKCLEKEPARRYGSAGELAQDLGRYLAGEPIAGRPVGGLERLGRRVRRNRLAAAAVAAASVAVLGSTAAVLVARRGATLRAAAAQRFGEEGERVEGVLRQAYLLPLHDTRAETAAARQRMRRIQAEMLRLGAVGRGSGHYALGRGHLMLGEWEPARRELERAWTEDRSPDAAVALGHAFARLYQDAVLDLERISDPALRQARRAQAESALRDPALRYLRLGAPSAREPAEYVEALVALCERRHDQALARARASFRARPSFYEAKLLEGDVHTLTAEEARHAGDYAAAATRLRAGREAYDAAAEVARSAPAVRARQCRAGVQHLELALESGADPGPAFAPALGACDQALRSDPDGVDTLSSLSRLHWRWADAQRDAPEEERRTVQRSIELGQRAVALDGMHVPARLNLANAFWQRADLERRTARDPLPSYQAAVAQFEAAARVEPDNPRALLGLGSVRNEMARHQAGRGGDPRAALAAAIAALEKAAALLPTVDAPRNNLGNAYLYQAEYEVKRGLDPAPSYAAALRWYDEGLRVNPNSYQEHLGRGLTLVSMALAGLERGADPAELIPPAERAFRRALDLRPRLASAEANFGRIEMLRAEAGRTRGQDPRPRLQRARAAFAKALAVSPRFSPAAISLATSHHAEGEYLLRAGQDPAPAVRAGLAWVQRARQLEGDADDADLWEARLYLLSARQALRARASAEAELARAEAALLAIERRRPPDVEVHSTRAQAGRVRGQWELRRARPQAAGRALAEGLARVDAALALHPSHPESLAERGGLLALKAEMDTAARFARRQR